MKEPWLAVNLSLFFPGIGQWYAGRRVRAVVLVLSSLLLLALFVWGFFTARGSSLAGIIAVMLFILLALAQLVDAHRTTPTESEPDAPEDPGRGRDPWLAFFWSRFIPGLGHLYARRWGWAVLFFVLWLVAAGLGEMLVSSPWVADLPMDLVLAFGAYHAFRIHGARREGGLRTARILAVVVLAASTLQVGGTAWVKQNIVDTFRVPTGSMMPTLQPGDFMFGMKRWSEPLERGSIVIFLNPTDPDRNMVKRVIGLPGERVEIRDRTVYVDGSALVEDYIAPSSGRPRPPAYRNPNIYPRGAGNRDNYGPVLVPAGHLFLLGDNRDNSDDSRFFGFVSLDLVTARAREIYWPPGRVGPIE